MEQYNTFYLWQNNKKTNIHVKTNSLENSYILFKNITQNSLNNGDIIECLGEYYIVQDNGIDFKQCPKPDTQKYQIGQTLVVYQHYVTDKFSFNIFSLTYKECARGFFKKVEITIKDIVYLPQFNKHYLVIDGFYDDPTIDLPIF